MQAKFKILLCVMFMLGLAVSQVNAQNAEFDINVTRNSVAQEGHNQLMGTLVFSAAASATDIDLSVPDAADSTT